MSQTGAAASSSEGGLGEAGMPIRKSPDESTISQRLERLGELSETG